MTPSPQYFTYDSERSVMVPRRKALADKTYVDGEEYYLDAIEERSMSSHRHEFAWLREAWKNLPEKIADLYPSPEHLRKRALIDCGYYHETVVDCGTNAAALRVASHLRSRDDFALVIVRGHLIFERTAKSQSIRAMRGAEFQASKQAMIELISGMVGTTKKALEDNAGKAA